MTIISASQHLWQFHLICHISLWLMDIATQGKVISTFLQHVVLNLNELQIDVQSWVNFQLKVLHFFEVLKYERTHYRDKNSLS